MPSEKAQGCLNGEHVKSRNVGVGCVIVLPKLKYLTENFPLEGNFVNIPCLRLTQTCLPGCKLGEKGFGHPVIVLKVCPESGVRAKTIQFVQVCHQITHKPQNTNVNLM